MMPVMDFRWGRRVAYLASVILPIFEHVYGIPHEGICPRLDIVDAQCRERAPGPAGAALLTALIRDSGAGARGPEVP